MALKQRSKGLRIAGIANGFFQGDLFAAIFVFFSKPSLTALLQTTSLHYILFPVAAATEVFALLISSLDLITTGNKNFGTVGQFIIDFIKASLVVIAVVGSIAFEVIFQNVSAIIFVAVLSMMSVYNLGLMLWNVFKYFTTDNVAEKATYKQNIINHAIGFGVTLAATIGIAFLMVTKVGPIISAILSIGTAGSLAIGAIYGGIMGIIGVRSEKNTATIAEELKHADDYPAPVLTQPSKSSLPVANYFYQQNRSESVKYYLAHNKDAEAKQFLIEEIDNKIDELQTQMGRAVRGNNYIEKSQEPKRLAKIELLKAEKEFLENGSVTTDAKDQNGSFIKLRSLDEISNYSKYNECLKTAYQSFWHKKGDVEDISDAVEDYVTLHEELSGLHMD